MKQNCIKIRFADVPGYEGVYKISSDGKVYSNKGIRSTYITRHGYESVGLCLHGKQKNFLVHRLVAMAFIPNPQPQKHPFINHIDGNKRNNNIENLEWCDSSYNMRHAIAHGLSKVRSKRVIQYTLGGEKIKVWNSIKEACDEIKACCIGNISKACQGKRKNAGGYIWKYADDDGVFYSRNISSTIGERT